MRNASHEDAILEFKHAEEPIMVEVSRRKTPADVNSLRHCPEFEHSGIHAWEKTKDTQDSPLSSRVTENCSVSVQTELSAEEVTLAAMAAAALTTEDICAALSLQQNLMPR